jgi:hypothetical protein
MSGSDSAKGLAMGAPTAPSTRRKGAERGMPDKGRLCDSAASGVGMGNLGGGGGGRGGAGGSIPAVEPIRRRHTMLRATLCLNKAMSFWQIYNRIIWKYVS